MIHGIPDEEVVRFSDAPEPPGATPWVGAREPEVGIRIVEYDDDWPARYAELEERVRGALGDAALAIRHIGSTSVPGLAAKDVVDVDVIVADTTDEASYVPALERAGFTLRIREPWWYEHRCFVQEDPRANIHLWSPDAAEPARHLIFRDWLRAHPDDRDAYLAAKRAAAGATEEQRVSEYNRRKQDVLREIYRRAFAALGLTPE